jgi:hypothetical protein
MFIADKNALLCRAFLYLAEKALATAPAVGSVFDY